ncbi:MAG: hypothetical protein EZS28_027329 [Streblomastix strix]|uniref:Uncharacterized protein n=1 Tax=Streblomastix strix TaxID=222440 RepID=A0A5J4V4Y3_9EUKA|nr:MAG: hypothetical protein EZS28_027329 [Streblomastix strix]
MQLEEEKQEDEECCIQIKYPTFNTDENEQDGNDEVQVVEIKQSDEDDNDGQIIDIDGQIEGQEQEQDNEEEQVNYNDEVDQQEEGTEEGQQDEEDKDNNGEENENGNNEDQREEEEEVDEDNNENDIDIEKDMAENDWDFKVQKKQGDDSDDEEDDNEDDNDDASESDSDDNSGEGYTSKPAIKPKKQEKINLQSKNINNKNNETNGQSKSFDITGITEIENEDLIDPSEDPNGERSMRNNKGQFVALYNSIVNAQVQEGQGIRLGNQVFGSYISVPLPSSPNIIPTISIIELTLIT